MKFNRLVQSAVIKHFQSLGLNGSIEVKQSKDWCGYTVRVERRLADRFIDIVNTLDRGVDCDYQLELNVPAKVRPDEPRIINVEFDVG